MAITPIILPIILVMLPFVCLAGEQRSLTRLIDPIEVSGSEVTDITGTKISNLRVIASSNGVLTPIPFQIDQKNSKNDWVWNSVAESDQVIDWINNEDAAQPDSQDNFTYDDQDISVKDVFDTNDVVVFLAKDIGDKDRERIKKVGAKRVVELEITDPVNQSKGWVYFAYFESDIPALSKVNYVQYEPDKFRVSGPDHEFLYSPNHTMVLDDFRLGGVSVISGNRIRGEVVAEIGPITLDFEFNEKSVQGYRAGYIDGPVRIVKRSVEHVQLGPVISSPEVNCDHFHYPWHAEVPILISKQFPVRRISILATSIFRGLKVTKSDADKIIKPTLLGAGSTQGNLLKENSNVEWIGLTGNRVSIINSVKVPDEHKGHIDVSPYVIDINAAPDTNDTKPVSEVEAGFLIRTTDKTPDGDHIIYSIYLFNLNTGKNEYQANAIKLLRHKLVINTTTLSQ